MILWYYRNFSVMSEAMAWKFNLTWYFNVHGDQINLLNCRSIYIDKKDRQYRIKEAYYKYLDFK